MMKATSLKSRVTRTLMMGLCLVAAPAVQASGIKVLEPRLSTVKPTSPELAPETPVQRLVVKFQEGTRVRLRSGMIRAMGSERSQGENQRMMRFGLSENRLQSDVEIALKLMMRAPRMGPPQRLFRQDELTLSERKDLAEQLSGREMADLDLYFEVPLRPGTLAGEVNALVMQLNAIHSVEIAYAEAAAEPVVFGIAADGEVPIAPVTYESQQGYLDPAPYGIDARYAWTVPGGTGSGVKIVDVEGAWNGSHEDLPPFFHEGGIEYLSTTWRNHGTAVMGIMVGRANGYGITGIAHGAQAGHEGIANQSIASAITRAALAAGPGGVVLLQLQAPGPRSTQNCACNVSQCNEIPLEYWQANFDAIAQATAHGVHVVEAAGNGSVNLDAPEYRGAFDRAVRDSGAILVGASSATSREPMCWSNHGSRVDVHGWGENVVTLGYGDLASTSENRWYTDSFSGTSSAAPMVVGTVANLQGIAYATGRGPIDPRSLRELLRVTGTPQAASTKQIGPLPNLRAAIPELLAR